MKKIQPYTIKVMKFIYMPLDWSLSDFTILYMCMWFMRDQSYFSQFVASYEMKAQVVFSDHLLSFCLSCKLFCFSSYPEPLGQFRSNSTQSRIQVSSNKRPWCPFVREGIITLLQNNRITFNQTWHKGIPGWRGLGGGWVLFKWWAILLAHLSQRLRWTFLIKICLLSFVFFVNFSRFHLLL